MSFASYRFVPYISPVAKTGDSAHIGKCFQFSILVILVEPHMTVIRVSRVVPLFVHKMECYNRTASILRCMLLLIVFLLAACAKPHIHPSPGNHTLPELAQNHALMEDGYRLPLLRWEPVDNAKAIVVAVHGLNDYSFAFDTVGQYLSSHGITVIAYDQRGFGNTTGRGLWHGSARLSEDLVTITKLLRRHNTGIPMYLMGESMGGAVALTSLASEPLDIDGTVLIAPAVWTRDTMPFYQRFGLWLATHTIPDTQLTGEGLDLEPSDNIEMLRALSRDPMVIKGVRVDVLYGISNLMDRAMLASSQVSGNMLVLYGKKDDIIPAIPTCELHERLSAHEGVRLTAITYEQGYHMLTRDLQAEVVLEDIAAWIANRETSEHNGSNMYDFCTDNTMASS